MYQDLLFLMECIKIINKAKLSMAGLRSYIQVHCFLLFKQLTYFYINWDAFSNSLFILNRLFHFLRNKKFIFSYILSLFLPLDHPNIINMIPNMAYLKRRLIIGPPPQLTYMIKKKLTSINIQIIYG